MNNYLNTLIEEKNIDLDQIIKVEGASGCLNLIPFSMLIDVIKSKSIDEQKKINEILIDIDFKNGNVMNFFKIFAQSLAR